MGDDHIKSDVELVVRKEKLHKPKVQQEVHDVPSIDVGDVSAKPVDDKPVLVGDKPDEATLVVDVDVAACATVPVCVDASMQTDDVCADGVSVHMAQMRVGGVGGERVSGDSGQRHYRARSTVQFSATPRMHRGKDGRVRHLCGPGITHLVQGHVQRHRGPSKPRKKKELAPKSKLIWRRKEAPSAVSSQAGREGGCGVEGKQDLKTARTCHVHITRLFEIEERKPGSDTKSATVTVEEDVPLSGLNMQLKKVQGDACKTVDKVQRWSLFQTQCIIKGKACKLMIDGGSCTNGISKAMVAALGLSTWRLPEPKRLEWLNSCGMLKITHKVRVPFTVGDYVDEIDCDVLPLEVCGLLLGRPWQYDRNVTHAGRANTYSFMHGGKQRTLKPMGDDHIKSDVELVVRKEKLHKPKVQQEVHDVPSIDVGDVSAKPVDDKPVLVGDKPDEATLVVDVDVAACATVPVCVDAKERKPGSDTKSTTVTVEEDVPLSGLNMQLKKVQGDACKTVDKVQRWSLFQTQCIIKGKACKLMIDGGSCTNGISKAMVAALGLSTWRLPEPKRLEWLNSCGMLKITHKVRVPFTVGDYVDEIDCDVLPLEVCGLLLGRPWQYDRNVTHAGRANTYSFMHGGKQRTLKPMGDDHIKSDVELVVRKEKLHKPKVQQEVHDVPSIDVGDVSAKPVDDKPVLVGDKPDEATLVVDVDVAACATVPVCVDASMQTDDVCADGVSVHMAQMRVGGVGGERVSGDSGQRHYRARSTVQFSATPRMHRGKDGRVRHLCGPGITHLVQGHVQRHRGPSKPRKKKELAPKSKLIWRRKEAPSAVSSQAGREGGCGVEGKQDLKTARTCHVHITSPFPEDPHALGTTLLEGGRMIRAWRPMWSPDSGLHQLNYLSLGNGHVWAN
ncbi:hypothetical protein QYE76_018378 [Lolium multiflorum]|uniref:Gag-pol polyprotein n=1 Tax=Lolium multiflorum TaxID=4521 RepID=A0AAD8Q5N1_LOLMU|nr:hypothetical protein QYE76_018378 [Lolium multiflorum]